MAFRPVWGNVSIDSIIYPGCPASLDHEALAKLGKEGGRDLDSPQLILLIFRYI